MEGTINIKKETSPCLDTTSPRLKPLLKKWDEEYPLNNTYTKDYLKFLDENKPFFELADDKRIKRIGKYNKAWLKILNVLACHLDLENLNKEFKLYDRENIVGKARKREFVRNYIMMIGESVLDIEVNSSEYRIASYKNILEFFLALYCKNGISEENEKWLEQEKPNIRIEIQKQECTEVKVVITNEQNGEKYELGGPIIVKYLENFYELYYSQSEKTDELALIAALKAKSYSELYEMMSQVLPDRMLASFMDSVVEMNEKIKENPEWPYETCDKEDLDEALDKGKTIGISQEKKNIANTLIERNMNIKEVSEITGLKEEEISKLQS